MSAPRSAARRILAHALSAGRRSEQSAGFAAPETASAGTRNLAAGAPETTPDADVGTHRDAVWPRLSPPNSARH